MGLKIKIPKKKSKPGSIYTDSTVGAFFEKSGITTDQIKALNADGDWAKIGAVVFFMWDSEFASLTKFQRSWLITVRDKIRMEK